MTPSDEVFEGERPRLKRLAYRMLGQLADAEDIVQETWLRWRRAAPEDLADPTAWLVRVATRLSIDQLRAERVRREAYRGPWLPDPLIEALTTDPVERAEEISIAFLLALERLSPLERAVLLLHDVFEVDYPAIAETLDRSEAACRQLLSRARGHVRGARSRYSATPADVSRFVTAFQAASDRGDLSPLSELLVEDAVLISDGGGVRSAALRPLIGREDVLRLIRGIMWRGPRPAPSAVRLARVNGGLGFVMTDAKGPMVLALEMSEGGRIAAIYLLCNPERLHPIVS